MKVNINGKIEYRTDSDQQRLNKVEKMKREETDFQKKVAAYLMENEIFFFHIPNERNTGIVEIQKMLAMGMKKGAPDLQVWTGQGWEWWELKAKKGKSSPEQICFAKQAEKFNVVYRIIDPLNWHIVECKQGVVLRVPKRV